MSKEMALSRDQAEAFYADHKDSEFFESLVDNMTRCVTLSKSLNHKCIKQSK